MVDDHHMILEGYQNVLSSLKVKNIFFNVDTADSCNLAWEKIGLGNYHMVMLDISFPFSKENKFFSGEDLGIKIRQEYPAIKVIILTMLQDSFRLHNILDNLNPEGFLLKGEITAKKLIECVETVAATPPYYGSRILKLLYSRASDKFTLDKTDRIILYQLSLGTRTKDLPNHVNLSLRAVEDRKKKLKEIFGVKGEGNNALLEKARESGYI